jgi:pimeloyl-ACP methyl ester carboxylesterase
VLVGHSFGGLNMRLFASRYPDEVVGLILVDATPEDFPAVESELRSTESLRRFETALSLASSAHRQELSTAEQSAEQVRASTLPPSLPVIVISSSRPAESPEFQQAWMQMQTDLATRLAAEQVVAERSGHFVQYDQPELVIEGIVRILTLVRNGSSS